MADAFKTEVTVSKSGFVFDHSSGLTFSLNPVGQFIFQQLEEGREPSDILTAITEEFAVDDATARKDLDDFLRQLRDLGFVD